jgi:hypothetical protein
MTSPHEQQAPSHPHFLAQPQPPQPLQAQPAQTIDWEEQRASIHRTVSNLHQVFASSLSENRDQMKALSDRVSKLTSMMVDQQALLLAVSAEVEQQLSEATLVQMQETDLLPLLPEYPTEL